MKKIKMIPAAVAACCLAGTAVAAPPDHASAFHPQVLPWFCSFSHPCSGAK